MHILERPVRFFFNLHLFELLIFFALKAKITGLKRDYCKLFKLLTNISLKAKMISLI
jgi:hypothetical protein